MKRTKRVAVVAHCLLNANTKVHHIAKYASVHPAAKQLIGEGAALVQLACPETTFLGMTRPKLTRDDYDTPDYRIHCRALLYPVVDTLTRLAEDGCDLLTVVGFEGSPSCAVGGPYDAAPGIFMEELQVLLGERNILVESRDAEELAASGV